MRYRSIIDSNLEEGPGKKPQVRWWVVAGAIVLSWALTCMGPTSAEGQAVLIAADSKTLSQLSALHEQKRADLAACMLVQMVDSVLVIDSVVSMVHEPPCPKGTNGLAGISLTEVSDDAVRQIASEVFVHFPQFLTVCIIHKTRPAHDGDDVLFLMPVMRCAIRAED